MSAPANGQRTSYKSEIALETRPASRMIPVSEITHINSRASGCCADHP